MLSPFGLKQELLYMMWQSGLSVDDLDYGKKAKGTGKWCKNFILDEMELNGITVEEMKKASRGISDDPKPEPLPMTFKDLMLTVASPEKEEVEEDDEENPFETLTWSDHEDLSPISYDYSSSSSEAVTVDDDDDDDEISDCEIKKKDDDDDVPTPLATTGAAAGEDKQQMDDDVLLCLPSVITYRRRGCKRTNDGEIKKKDDDVPTPPLATADKQMDDGVPTDEDDVLLCLPSVSNKRLRPLPDSP